MKLTTEQIWSIIRECVVKKETHKLNNFSFSLGEGNYIRKALYCDWAIERDYDQKGKTIPKGQERPIEICLTMEPLNASKDKYCPPCFIWSCDPFYSKELNMEPLMLFDI